MKISVMRYAFLVLVACLLITSALAQQTAPSAQQPPAAPQSQQTAPQAPSGQSQPADKSPADKNADKNKDQEDSTKKPAATSNDRLFFALPNFLTLENAGQVPPLTTGQKFKVVARGSFDYIQIPWYAVLAGVSQAENSEPGYGQGAQGYGKRFGAYAADGTIENFMVGAVLPSVFKQDPRYFQNGKGGFWHRTGYAVSRIFVTRTDAGGEQFNISEIGGAVAASFISTYSYHPSGDCTVTNTMSVWGSQVGYDTITLVVKEFWPDIRRKLKKKK